jgi:hypothetical protein
MRRHFLPIKESYTIRLMLMGRWPMATTLAREGRLSEIRRGAFQGGLRSILFAIWGTKGFDGGFKSMHESSQRTGMKTGRIRVTTLSQLDALVGEHVTGDAPDVAWQDSYGLFRFNSRDEAEEAIHNSYYRLFRPELDWDTATIEEVRLFRPYSSDLMAAWEIVERLGAESRQTEIRREGESWRAAFSGTEAFAATPALAICLAALRASGVDPIFCESLLEEDFSSPVDSGEESETVDIL